MHSTAARPRLRGRQRPLAAGETLYANFSRLLVYHIEGFDAGKSPIGPLDQAIDGRQVSVVVAVAVNEACQLLLGEDYVDDAEEWQKIRGLADHICF